jgi:hypothetical protein
MGRPLFSASYSTPAVRTEPEKAPPSIHFEKWTHWNAFDPDSDEFFERDDAVYEAFLDPANVLPSTEDRTEGGAEAPEPERLDAIIARELEDSRGYSSASSEGTISGRGSPMAVGSDDPAGMIVDAYRAGEFEAHRQRELESEDTGRMVRHQNIEPEYRTVWENPAMDPPRDGNLPDPVDAPPRGSFAMVMPPLSPFRSRGFVPRIPPSTRATTPPPPLDQDQDDVYVTHVHTNPSPPPTVTPRLYSWSSRGPSGRGDPGSPTPVQRQRPRPGPLTNPNARLSLAHLSPAPVRVRMS